MQMKEIEMRVSQEARICGAGSSGRKVNSEYIWACMGVQ
jgi:hypothetical protein